MKRITQAFLLAALVLFAAPSCSPFTACVKPYTSQLSWTGTVTELGDVVGAFLLCDPTFNGGDAPVCALESLNQLEATLGPDGKAIIDCIVAYYTTNGTPKQNAAAKAVGLKRGVNRSAFCPTLEKISPAPQALQAPAVPGTTASGNLTLASCDRACGGRGTSIAPPSGCSCWRPSKTDWRASRWVPLRAAPGLGLVAAR